MHFELLNSFCMIVYHISLKVVQLECYLSTVRILNNCSGGNCCLDKVINLAEWLQFTAGLFG